MLGRDLQRGLFVAETVHMEICSHFFLCASPFTNGNDCFVASSHYISLPGDVKLALGENPQWLGVKPSLCHGGCPTRSGEQGVSEAERILPSPKCLSQQQKKRQLVGEYRVHVYKWIPPERCRCMLVFKGISKISKMVLSKMCTLVLLTVMLKICSTAYITLNSRAQVGQRV